VGSGVASVESFEIGAAAVQVARRKMVRSILCKFEAEFEAEGIRIQNFVLAV
jgi:hypothetical protein